jgi:hypothetical protein
MADGRSPHWVKREAGFKKIAENGMPIALRLVASQPAVKLSRKTYPYAGLGSSSAAAAPERVGKMGANDRVNRVELRSRSGHRTDAHDRDKGGDQTIFNGCDAGFIFEEAYKLFHFQHSASITGLQEIGGRAAEPGGPQKYDRVRDQKRVTHTEFGAERLPN